jgi:hypothetical protein
MILFAVNKHRLKYDMLDGWMVEREAGRICEVFLKEVGW